MLESHRIAEILLTAALVEITCGIRSKEAQKLRVKTWLGVAAVGVTVGTLAAGCGTASASAPTLLRQVKTSHQLVLAVSAFAPEDFQNPATHQWTGYDINILGGFAKTLGAKLVVHPMPFASSITAVADRRAAMTIDIYWTAKRAKVLSFSRPMLNYNDVVAVNSRHPQVAAPTLADLAGKRIAVVIGSEEVGEAQKVPHGTVKEYGNITDSLLALSSGRVAADFQPGVDIAWVKHKNPGLHVTILGAVPASITPPVASLRGYYGVPKGTYSQSFLRQLNAYLQKIARNGTEQKILDQYGMTSGVFLKGIAQAPNVYHGGA